MTIWLLPLSLSRKLVFPCSVSRLPGGGRDEPPAADAPATPGTRSSSLQNFLVQSRKSRINPARKKRSPSPTKAAAPPPQVLEPSATTKKVPTNASITPMSISFSDFIVSTSLIKAEGVHADRHLVFGIITSQLRLRWNSQYGKRCFRTNTLKQHPPLIYILPAYIFHRTIPVAYTH